jgi:hypothetical protein
VDYAGLFPPAQLSLPEAMTTYANAQSSCHRWLLDRFVLPVASLPDWIKLLPHFPHQPDPFAPLSIILSQNWATELEQIQQANTIASEAGYSLFISAVEVAPLAPSEIEAVGSRFPSVDVFFEIPFDVELEPYLKALSHTGRAAKLRTGGISAKAFPDSTQLGQRILAFAAARIPFKATAGLHHPLRGDYCLTYQPDSPVAPMHGFLNLAILTTLAYQQSLSLDQAIALLEESSLASFQFSDTAIDWRTYSLSLTDIARSRQEFFRSFGSCSFQDPINDLHHLQLL